MATVAITRKQLKEAAVASLAHRRLKGDSLDKIADEIVMFSENVAAMMKSRLREDTIYLLVQDAIGQGSHTKYRPVPLKTIKAVIEGMMRLREAHIKEKK